jgi:predicted protein tyrosine phosphatase
MNTRVKDVVKKLYRPPASGRQVLALSRGDAEKIPLITGVAMISITASEKPVANLPEYPHLLRLSFADVDFLGDISARAAAKLPLAMTKGDAEEIVEFVHSLPEDVRSLVVHCEGGFSRSCGVVKALNLIYGYSVEEERLVRANQSVAKVIVNVAADRGGDSGRRGRRK